MKEKQQNSNVLDANKNPVVDANVMLAVAENDELLEVARKAVEDALIGIRDSRLSEPFRANGLVIKERNGKDSHIIRFGSETAIRIGLKAIAEHLKRQA